MSPRSERRVDVECCDEKKKKKKEPGLGRVLVSACQLTGSVWAWTLFGAFGRSALTTAQTEHSFVACCRRGCVRLRMNGSVLPRIHLRVRSNTADERAKEERDGLAEGHRGEECQREGGLAKRRLSSEGRIYYSVELIKTTESRRHWGPSSTCIGRRQVG